MPNDRVAKTVIAVGNVPHQGLAFRVFPGSNGVPNKSYAAFVREFKVSHPNLGTLDEDNLFFQAWSPVPGDDKSDPDNRGIFGEPRPEARRLLQLLPERLDSVISEIGSFDRDVYSTAVARAEPTSPDAPQTALAMRIGLDDSDDAVRGVSNATFTVDNEGRRALRHLRDAFGPNSLVRTLLEFEVIRQAMDIAADYWAAPRDAKAADGIKPAIPAKENWSRSNLTGNLPNWIRWLFTLIRRENHMPAGWVPDGVSAAFFSSEINLYSQTYQTTDGKTAYVVDLPLATVGRVSASQIQERLEKFLLQLRSAFQINATEQLPARVVAFAEAFVRRVCGQVSLDEFYLPRIVRDALVDLADVAGGRIEEYRRQGDAKAVAWRNRNINVAVPSDSDLQTEAATFYQGDRTNQGVQDDKHLCNRAAGALVGAMSGKFGLKQVARDLMYALPTRNASVHASSTLNSSDIDGCNSRLLVSSHGGASVLAPLLPAPAGQPALLRQQNQPALAPRETSGQQLAPGVVAGDPGPMTANALSNYGESKPLKIIANWTHGEIVRVFAPQRQRQGEAGQAHNAQNPIDISRAALRRHYLALIMLHEGVDFRNDHGARPAGVLTELLNYNGDFHAMLKVVPLDTFTDTRSHTGLKAAHDNAEAAYDNVKRDAVGVLSFCYGLRELFRACATGDAKIGVFVGKAEAFLNPTGSDNETAGYYRTDPRFHPTTMHGGHGDVPLCVYVHDTAFDDFASKQRWLETLPSSGMPSVIPGFESHPVPPLLVDTKPVGEDGRLGSHPQPKNGAIEVNYVSWVGPGLRARGICDGRDRLPFVPGGFLLLAGMVGGELLGRMGPSVYPTFVADGDDVHFLLVARGSENRNGLTVPLANDDWVFRARALLGWSPAIRSAENRPQMKNPPFGAVVATWFSVLSRTGVAGVQIGTAREATRWPFAATMPAWCDPANDMRIQFSGSILQIVNRAGTVQTDTSFGTGRFVSTNSWHAAACPPLAAPAAANAPRRI